MSVNIKPSVMPRDTNSPDVQELEALLVNEMMGGEDDGPLSTTIGGMPFRTESPQLARPVNGSDVFVGDSKYDPMPEARHMELSEVRQEIKTRERDAREQERYEQEHADDPQQA